MPEILPAPAVKKNGEAIFLAPRFKAFDDTDRGKLYLYSDAAGFQEFTLPDHFMFFAPLPCWTAMITS